MSHPLNKSLIFFCYSDISISTCVSFLHQVHLTDLIILSRMILYVIEQWTSNNDNRLRIQDTPNLPDLTTINLITSRTIKNPKIVSFVTIDYSLSGKLKKKTQSHETEIHTNKKAFQQDAYCAHVNCTCFSGHHQMLLQCGEGS